MDKDNRRSDLDEAAPGWEKMSTIELRRAIGTVSTNTGGRAHLRRLYDSLITISDDTPPPPKKPAPVAKRKKQTTIKGAKNGR